MIGLELLAAVACVAVMAIGVFVVAALALASSSDRSRARATAERQRDLAEAVGAARARIARPDRVGAFPPDRPVDDVVVIDVETTARDPYKGRVVEIAFVTLSGRALASLVNPGGKIPKAATDLHGITTADVAAAPSFVEVWDRARAEGFLTPYPLAYHAPYDQRVIAMELARAGRLDDSHQVLSLEWLDPCVRVRELDVGSAALTEACIRRGIRIGRPHRALDDARATLDLFLALEREAPFYSREALAYVVGSQQADRDAYDAARRQ